MGLLIEGVWHPGMHHNTDETGGRFERRASSFRNWVTADGSAGPTGEAGFKAQAGRYHLYVQTGCPWAHRTLIVRHLKGLDDAISVTRLVPEMSENGWYFPTDAHSEPRAEPDPLFRSRYLYEVYLQADPHCTTRATVPVLWDKQTAQLVNNESSEIIRMFNSAFNDISNNPELDLYPQALQSQIDALNADVYDNINNGVYKCGFATTQQAYEEAFDALFASLDRLESRLGESRYLLGERITAADWCLYPTLLRFDWVYYGLFKCNLRRVADYPNLSNYLCELHQTPGLPVLVDPGDLKRFYYSLENVWYGVTSIIPSGPDQDLGRPHDRARLPAAA